MIQAKPDQMIPIPGPDLVQAAAAGDLAALATLAQEAARLKSHGEAALFAACQKGQLAAVQYLAGLGVPLTGVYQDVMNATHINNYPLFIAAFHKQWAVVDWLLQQGVVDRDGHLRWALHNIVEDGALDLFARVINSIADISVFFRRRVGIPQLYAGLCGGDGKRRSSHRGHAARCRYSGGGADDQGLAV